MLNYGRGRAGRFWTNKLSGGGGVVEKVLSG